MVELRKRKTPPPQPEKPAKKKPGPKSKAQKAKEAAAEADVAKAKEVVAETAADVKTTVEETAAKAEETAASATNGAIQAVTGGQPVKGNTINLEGFGGEIETHDGKKVTLKQLVEESKDGIVLFTYPKASTPGCTKQACLFRDSYTPLTTTGFSIFGLSTDSPKANTTFKTKQKLPYTLLCDPSAALIKAIGLAKVPKGTTRGVFVVDKAGKVLAAEPGGPDATVDVVRKLVADKGDAGKAGDVSEAKESAEKEDKAQADVAGEVADTAAKLDGEEK